MTSLPQGRPPFRADHVGSLLRPPVLRQAFRDHMGKRIDDAAFAGIQPHLDAEDLEYSREILRPLLGESAYPIWIAALYGDEAARILGYEPLGLSDRAGLAVAVADAAAGGLGQ